MLKYFYDTDSVSLKTVGGKAQSLIKMTQAGFQVPKGFVLTTEFFAPWLKRLKLRKEWALFLETPSKENCDKLKAVVLDFQLGSTEREKFKEALKQLPDDKFFAIRSSSPEEDLENTSFAGMYDTFLGVAKKDIEKNINLAFQSMLDNRVVEYKKLNSISLENPEIAIIVQEQLASELSGIAFSINPHNNAFDECMINASFGLGETIVSGQVTPDIFVVDKIKKMILEKNIMSKEIGLWMNTSGGTYEQRIENPIQASLSDDQAIAVANLASKCEAFYAYPVDIEWAFVQDELFLLQARPITTYNPLYKEMLTEAGEKKNLYIDLAVLTQGFSEAFSVLGLEIWTLMLQHAKQGLMPEGKDGIIFNVHGRQYMHISNYTKALGEKAVRKTLGTYEQPIRKVFESLDLANDFKPEKTSPKLKQMKRDTFKLIFKLLPLMITGLSNPEKSAKNYENSANKIFDYCNNELMRDQAFDEMTIEGLSRFGSLAKGATGLLAGYMAPSKMKKLFKGHDVEHLVTALSMDLPNNPTSEMGYLMMKLASYDELQHTYDAETFVKNIESANYSKEFMADYNYYMLHFGMRGFKEIDIASPRSSENLSNFFNQLIMLNINDNAMISVKDKKEKAYNELLELAKGSGKEKKFKHLAHTYNSLMGYREHPKYIYVVIVGVLRKRALELGREFVHANRLDEVEHIFDLSIEEVTLAEKDNEIDLRVLRENNLRPRLALKHIKHWPKIVDSRGKIYRYLQESEEGDLIGDPIASGTYKGRAKVLSTPYEKRLEVGDILVTRATEPSWTPVFVNASAVVLEIGGPLQHGAIIAREYGLPCVSGIEGVTEIIKDGDLIEVDGDTGIVKIIEPALDQ